MDTTPGGRTIMMTNHFGNDCSACCRRGPYFPPITSEATPQHVAVAVPTPTNHFVAVPISHQPLRNRLLSMLLSRSLLPTNHFGTDSTECCRRGPYSHQPLRRGPYFSPTTSEPTAQHVAVAVPTSHQPLRSRVLSMLLSRSLLPTNHIGTDCSACCCRGPYFPPTTSEPTAQHVAVAVPISHQPQRNQPLRNRLLSMLPSRSLLPTNHFRTDCSACCPRCPYFPPTTSEPTAQHVAVAVPTPTNHFVAVPISHQPLRNRLLTVAVPTSHQPLRNRLLSMLPSRSL